MEPHDKPINSIADDGETPEPFPDYDDDVHECANCGGEGFTYGCSWDWQCDTYHEGEGTCLCMSHCDWCNPAKLTDEQKRAQAELRQVLADALKERGDG